MYYDSIWEIAFVNSVFSHGSNSATKSHSLRWRPGRGHRRFYAAPQPGLLLWLKLCPLSTNSTSLLWPQVSVVLGSQDHLPSLLHLVGPCHSLASDSAVREGWTSGPRPTVALSSLLGKDCSPDGWEASCTVAPSKGQHGKSSLVIQLFFNLPLIFSSPGSSSETG